MHPLSIREDRRIKFVNDVHCCMYSDFKNTYTTSLISTPVWLISFIKSKTRGDYSDPGLGSLSSLVIAENKFEAERILKKYWKGLPLTIQHIGWIEESKWDDKFVYWERI